MAKVINKNGIGVDFEAAVQYMDDDIREAVHADFAPCTEQEFFAAYETAHEAAHGKEWVLSNDNPSW